MAINKDIIEKFSSFEQECKRSGITFRNIVDLMKRDTALPPEEGSIVENRWSNYWHCPVCKNKVGVEDIHNNFCSHCGQRIKWKR